MSEFKKILLLGNGINRCFGKMSWGDLLKDIANDKNNKYLDMNIVPMPFKAFIVTNDHIQSKLKERAEKMWGSVDNDELKEVLMKVLRIGFDDILTTNYSYELEATAIGANKISRYQLEKQK